MRSRNDSTRHRQARNVPLIPHVLVAGFVLAAVIGFAPVAMPWQGQSLPGMERLGPFVLGPTARDRVTVVANYREPDTGWEEEKKTLTSWMILDANGAQLFHQIVDSQRHPEEFAANNVIARATVLLGQQRRFLLVELFYLPSAPGGGLIYYVFGVDRTGKLRQLARLIQDGDGLRNRPGADGQMRLAEGRYLDLGVWTSWFEMTFRYEYDEAREEFAPRNRCSAVRRVTIRREIVEEHVAGRDNTILLHRDLQASPAEPITVTPTRQVQPLQACVSAAPPLGSLGERTLFLQIRIDGKEGWVDESDFPRLGLQQAG
jgi:hypothetical protein